MATSWQKKTQQEKGCKQVARFYCCISIDISPFFFFSHFVVVRPVCVLLFSLRIQFSVWNMYTLCVCIYRVFAYFCSKGTWNFWRRPTNECKCAIELIVRKVALPYVKKKYARFAYTQIEHELVERFTLLRFKQIHCNYHNPSHFFLHFTKIPQWKWKRLGWRVESIN